MALGEKNYGRAEEDAKALLERYPGSQLKPQALGVLTGVAWELRRFRTAADWAAQLRAQLPPGDARAQLGVLVADAYFRAGDFKNAADAYGSAQREPPASVIHTKMTSLVVASAGLLHCNVNGFAGLMAWAAAKLVRCCAAGYTATGIASTGNWNPLCSVAIANM